MYISITNSIYHIWILPSTILHVFPIVRLDLIDCLDRTNSKTMERVVSNMCELGDFFSICPIGKSDYLYNVIVKGFSRPMSSNPKFTKHRKVHALGVNFSVCLGNRWFKFVNNYDKYLLELLFLVRKRSEDALCNDSYYYRIDITVS